MADFKSMMALFGFCFIYMLCITEALNADGTCNSDSDCPFSFYHCCTGTKWCCPSGYICTGTSTCIGIGVIIGPIVGLVVIIACVVVCCICYKKKQQTPGVVFNPQAQPAYGQSNPAYGSPQPQPYSVQLPMPTNA
uniref:Cysteine and tyrosine-rich protein 1 n=1 Tax=Magallana gigas TaxID=29159 RepID=A0A8W8IEU1_MAGGI